MAGGYYSAQKLSNTALTRQDNFDTLFVYSGPVLLIQQLWVPNSSFFLLGKDELLPLLMRHTTVRAYMTADNGTTQLMVRLRSIVDGLTPQQVSTLLLLDDGALLALLAQMHSQEAHIPLESTGGETTPLPFKDVRIPFTVQGVDFVAIGFLEPYEEGIPAELVLQRYGSRMVDSEDDVDLLLRNRGAIPEGISTWLCTAIREQTEPHRITTLCIWSDRIERTAARDHTQWGRYQLLLCRA